MGTQVLTGNTSLFLTKSDLTTFMVIKTFSKCGGGATDV